VIANQLKRQNDELIKLREILDAKNVSELKLQVNKLGHILTLTERYSLHCMVKLFVKYNIVKGIS
jgi:hypothetical protein